jgi:prephenate dehydrogenase
MNKDFPHITILGGGLLGGSLAQALQNSETLSCVTLWARRQETAESATRMGIRNATSDLTLAVQNADLAILAVPVGAMPSLVEKAIRSGMPKTCLLTDVGSVKRTPHQQLRQLLIKSDMRFIGSHPMAGSERNGISAVAATLFESAACLLTNDDQVEPTLAQALERFWQGLGCQTTWMTAAEHDALVARISHLPHAVAAATTRVCLTAPEDGNFGGGGLRDTTRVASGNPAMWAEILTENREALDAPLEKTIKELQTLLDHLRADDQEATRQWLATAKNLRDLLNPPS